MSAVHLVHSTCSLINHGKIIFISRLSISHNFFFKIYSYLFNSGEGSQRLAHEHKFKLSKVENIFFTRTSWQNVGGLPGISLTIQDVGVPHITLHGPPGLVEKIWPLDTF